MRMARLVKRCCNNPAVPTGFDLDFILDIGHKEYEGLQAIFDRLCELEEKIEKDELTGVVRCKDCKHFDEHTGKCYVFCDEEYHVELEVDSDHFCSYGERREGECK
jgi:hypothetical protein